MHTFSRWIALATLVSGVAYADKNDIQISLLGRPDKADVDSMNCTEGTKLDLCSTGSSRFQAFARTLGAAITSTNLMPPETVGHSGFNVNVELSIINLPSDTRIPTEGDQPGAVLMPSLHVRKGLPFSIEMGARVGWVERSRMLAATGELKWAIHEGFSVINAPEKEDMSVLDTIIKYLPDIGVRGHVTRLTNVRDFDLTATGVDLGAGKQFPVFNQATLTPYGGLDFTFIGADTTVINFNPDRAYEDTLGDDTQDFLSEDTGVYRRVRLKNNMTQRIYGGVRFIGGAIQLGAEVSVSRLGSVKLDPNNENSESRSLTSVLTFNTSLGLDF